MITVAAILGAYLPYAFKISDMTLAQKGCQNLIVPFYYHLYALTWYIANFNFAQDIIYLFLFSGKNEDCGFMKSALFFILFRVLKV